jgi:hypothetical protein
MPFGQLHKSLFQLVGLTGQCSWRKSDRDRQMCLADARRADQNRDVPGVP